MQELIESMKQLIELRKAAADDCKPAIDKAIDAIVSAIAERARQGVPGPYPRIPPNLPKQQPYWQSVPATSCDK